jgi:hypothetical protein
MDFSALSKAECANQLENACNDLTESREKVIELAKCASPESLDKCFTELAGALARTSQHCAAECSIITQKLLSFKPATSKGALKALEAASSTFFGSLVPTINTASLKALVSCGIHSMLNEEETSKLFQHVVSYNFWEERLSSDDVIDLLVEALQPSVSILNAALLACADGGRVSCIKKLISLGANVNATEEGQSVLERACCSDILRGDKTIWESRVTLLLDSGAKIVPGPILKHATKHGQSIAVIKRLLDLGAEVLPETLYAACSLQTPHRRGGIEQRTLSLELAKLFLGKGADPREEFGSVSCLSACYSSGNEETAEEILSALRVTKGVGTPPKRMRLTPDRSTH